MKFTNRVLNLGRVALVLSAGMALSAQESGQISGTVKSADGQPIARATVKISAPQLIQARVVVTDAAGVYRAPLLPSGDYRIEISAPNFIGKSATGLRMGLGQKMTQDFVLKALKDEAKATVEVIAVAGELDKADTKASTNFSNEQLASIPAPTREFYGAADMSPGVTAGVSGSFVIRGGTTQSTMYTLNGVSVKDDYQGDLTSQRVIDDAIEDIQVVQSPLNARYGRTAGGVINVQTKSGGNDFSGSLRYTLTRDDWGAYRRNGVGQESGRSNAYSNREWQIFFSGPIIKDKLWFAVSTIQLPKVSSSDTILRGANPANWQPNGPNGNGRTFVATTLGFADYATMRSTLPLYQWDRGVNYLIGSEQDYFDGKLTYALSQDHTFEFGMQSSKSTTTNRNPYGTGSPIVGTMASNSGSQKSENKYWTYGYKGTLASNIFVEARYSDLISKATFPSPLLDHVRINYAGATSNLIFPYGFNTSPRPDQRNNQSGDLNVKIFGELMGSHEIDAGVQFYEFIRGTSTQNGPNNQRFYNSYATAANPALAAAYGWAGHTAGLDPYGSAVWFLAANYAWANKVAGHLTPGIPAGTTVQNGVIGIAPVYRKYYGADGTTKNRTSSLYINDQWTLNNHWNLMGGLRYDRQKIYDTDGTILRAYDLGLQPRLQVRYDIGGDGARLVTFTAARFNDDLTYGLTDTFVKQANSKYTDLGWSAFADGDIRFVDYAALTNPANYAMAGDRSNLINFYNSSLNNTGLQTLKGAYAMEYTLGYRRSYKDGSYVGLTYVNKEYKNIVANVQDFTSDYLVDAPDPSGSGLSRTTLQSHWINSNDLTRAFHSLELDFRNNINSTWTVGGNYTWSRLTGNNNAGDSASQSFRDNGPTGYNFLQSWLQGGMAAATGDSSLVYSSQEYAPDGVLLNDQTHKARVHITAQVPLGKGRISYSWLFKYDSGSAYTPSGAADSRRSAFTATLPVAQQGVTLPSQFTYFPIGRGAYRLPDFYSCDFKIAFELPMGFRKTAIMGDIKINNFFNSQRQVDFNRSFGQSAYLAKGQTVTALNPSLFGSDEGAYYNYAAARTVSATLGIKF